MTKTISAFALAFLTATILGSPAIAAPMSSDRLPDSLKSWVSWVMHGNEVAACPPAFNDTKLRSCAWPGELAIELTERAGSFRQRVDIFAPDTVIPLPGDAEVWPQDVRVDGKPVAVVSVQGKPSVRLPPGRYVITGALPWTDLPQNLTVPTASGVLRVTLNGAPIASVPDTEGRIWLKSGTDAAQSEDALSIRTFRNFEDGVPLRSIVRYQLSVSGKPREIRLPGAVLKDWTAASIDSPLPARIAADGTASVQARAGTWTISVGARRTAPTVEFALPAEASGDEIWSLQAHNEVRVVTAQGLPTVNPKNVGAPAEWASFPTFLAHPGTTLKLIEARRGNAEGDADKISVQRTFWLDFDGAGLTVQDHLSGQLGKTWRLDLSPPFTLGRVAVNGVDSAITTSGSGGARGVELRNAALALEADSRLDSGSRTVPASGWSADVTGWTGTLHLPPGWRLLHVGGADSTSGAWLSSWTLWDLFFVAVLVAGTFRLFGWQVAVAIAAGLILSWHSRAIPIFPWVGLILTSALVISVPDGRLRHWATRGRLAFAVMALFLLIPFAVSQVRQAIYPSLQFRAYPATQPAAPGVAALHKRAPVQAPAEADAGRNELELKAKAAGKADKSEALADRPAPAASVDSLTVVGETVSEPAISKYASSERRYDRVNPNAKSLTGPGIPSWSWQSFHMAIQGPLAPDQMLTFVVLPPWASALWGLMSVLGLAYALWRTGGFSPTRVSAGIKAMIGKTAMFAIVLAAVIGHSPDSMAAKETPAAQSSDSAQSSPSPAILGELRERLTAPPDCMPACAELARLNLSATPDRIVIRAQYHAQAAVSVPLPGLGPRARASSIAGGAGALPLRRDEAGIVWASLPAGVSEITIEVPTSGLSLLPVTLPMVPHQVVSDLPGWSLAGLDARGLATGSIQINRHATTASSGAQVAANKDSLAPFFRVERILSLGQTWTIATRIQRDGQSNAPATVRVALLDGESVTDPSIRVDNGDAIIEIGQNAAASFASSLKPGPVVRLKAAAVSSQTETWMLDASPLWHVALKGIPPVFQKRGDEWAPVWWPWPGEEIQLAINKPVAVDGSTLTFDSVSLRSSIGHRSSDVKAEMRLRSATGGNHTFTLPEGATLLTVGIDNVVQPLRSDGRKLVVPITPGAHLVKIEWREAAGISSSYSSPQLDIGVPAVNAFVEMVVPRDRVVLMTSGPLIGPAVLLWGVVIVTLALAVLAGRYTDTPLRTIDWLLLGIGLVQWSMAATALVTAWFLAMAYRKRMPLVKTAWRFNLVQLLLLALTVTAASALAAVLKNGLVGYPDLLVAGNGSTAFLLRWYQDRIGDLTPTVWMFSIPVIAYRAAMLGWALWLAFSLLTWIKWAWFCYAWQEYWRPMHIFTKKKLAAPAEPAASIESGS